MSATWPTLAARDSFAKSTDLCHQYRLSAVEKVIGGVVNTSEHFSRMLLIPVRNNQKA
jgi:hypothetical protein